MLLVYKVSLTRRTNDSFLTSRQYQNILGELITGLNQQGDHGPEITVNRVRAKRHAMNPAKDPRASNSAFVQVFTNVKRNFGGRPLRELACFNRFFRVTFEGEGATDCDELSIPYFCCC